MMDTNALLSSVENDYRKRFRSRLLRMSDDGTAGSRPAPGSAERLATRNCCRFIRLALGLIPLFFAGAGCVLVSPCDGGVDRDRPASLRTGRSHASKVHHEGCG